MTTSSALGLSSLPEVPLVRAGDDVAELLAASLERIGGLETGDVVVVAQKIVSKAEARAVRLAEVTPGDRALELAAACGKDPALVELVLRESLSVVRVAKDVLIVRHRLGHVMANAGIDQSNVSQEAGTVALLLPVDPDASADRIRESLGRRFGVLPGVVIADSFGRAWRVGTTGTCIGSAGLSPLLDLRGQPDLFGRRLEVSQQAVGDEIAAAASLLMGQGREGVPAVRIRGLSLDPGGNTADLIRPVEQDLFS